MGAEKEEGRLKEDSLSETLRVLVTAAGLGEPNMKCPQMKNKHYTKGKAFWSEHRATHRETHEGSKQWQETCDAIVQG